MNRLALKKWIVLAKVSVAVIILSLFYESLANSLQILLDLAIYLLTGGAGNQVSSIVTGAAKVYFARAFLGVSLVEGVFWITNHTSISSLKKVTIVSFWVSIFPFVITPLVYDPDFKSIVSCAMSIFTAAIVHKYIAERFDSNPYPEKFHIHLKKINNAESNNILFSTMKLLIVTAIQPKFWQNRIGTTSFINRYDKSFSEEIVEDNSKSYISSSIKWSLFLQSILFSLGVSLVCSLLFYKINFPQIIGGTICGIICYYILCLSSSPWFSLLIIPIPVLCFYAANSTYDLDLIKNTNWSFIITITIIAFLTSILSEHIDSVFSKPIFNDIVGSIRKDYQKILLIFLIGILLAFFSIFTSIFSFLTIGLPIAGLIQKIIGFFSINPSFLLFLYVYIGYYSMMLIGLIICIGIPIYLRLLRRTKIEYEVNLGFSSIKASKIAFIVATTLLAITFVISLDIEFLYLGKIIDGIFIGMLIATTYLTMFNIMLEKYPDLNRSFFSGLFISIVVLPLLPFVISSINMTYVLGKDYGDNIKGYGNFLKSYFTSFSFFTSFFASLLTYLVTWELLRFKYLLIYPFEVIFNLLILILDMLSRVSGRAYFSYHTSLFNSLNKLSYPFMTYHLSIVWEVNESDLQSITYRLFEKGYEKELKDALKIHCVKKLCPCASIDDVFRIGEKIKILLNKINNDKITTDISPLVSDIDFIKTNLHSSEKCKEVKEKILDIEKNIHVVDTIQKFIANLYITTSKNRKRKILNEITCPPENETNPS